MMLFPKNILVRFFLLAAAASSAGVVNGKGTESDDAGREVCDATQVPAFKRIVEAIVKSAPDGTDIVAGLNAFKDDGIGPVGSVTDLYIFAADASASGIEVEDGRSSDIDFPFGKLKPIATMGEYSACDDGYRGTQLVGPPDGIGSYLIDDETVRVVFQSESYGALAQLRTPLGTETSPWYVNNETVKLSGSRIQNVDYDRSMMKSFMDSDVPASAMVVGVGNMVETMINIAGDEVGPRNKTGNTETGFHSGNCNAAGEYVVFSDPGSDRYDYDWFVQSLCSAHLEHKHQFGDGIGVEDDLFITNEEWIYYKPNSTFVGLSAHTLDLDTKTMYATGVFGFGGYEKIVELNPRHEDYVVFAVSGYTGDFRNFERVLELRNEEYGPREDGKPYVWTNNVKPMEIYIGVKGKMEDGSDAPEDDFLARNGLRYGKVYGFAIDMSETGPTKGVWRDDFHRDPEMAKNGALIEGKWVPVDWQWDGVVKDYQHDIAWNYQNPVKDMENYWYWTAAGPDEGGCKCEHLDPDTRAGKTAFVQASTCGYLGHYYVHTLLPALKSAGGGLPDALDGEYWVYQGELDVTSQIDLGGKGQYVNGLDATMAYDNSGNVTAGKKTFEDIDGLGHIISKTGRYLIIQEDSTSLYGDRMFITRLEHAADDKELKYKLAAICPGPLSTVQQEAIGVPASSMSNNCVPYANEFSGVHDVSGLLATNDDGSWICHDDSNLGQCRLEAAAEVDINDKDILINLQAHNLQCGMIGGLGADRGGQIYIYRPEV